MSMLNQYGALPYVVTDDGVLVCLITSRGSRRWVIPKGWPKPTHPGHEMAAREAREEAGLLGAIEAEPVGSYVYRKRLHMFARVQCRVTVFPLLVETQLCMWPEKAERNLVWLPPRKAAKRVAEAELSQIILALPARLASVAGLPVESSTSKPGSSGYSSSGM